MNILKNNKIRPIFAGVVLAVCLLGITIPQATYADPASPSNAAYVAKKTIKVVITAYSSTADQTDSTPFITASGKQVADGIIANNMLPFGTKVRIPKLYGEKIFIVQDRMNSRKSNYHIDIWMPDRLSAVNFGVKTVDIEVLEG